MRRLWIGVGLLAVMLAGALLLAEITERSHAPAAKALREASSFAEAGKWQQARGSAGEAQSLWKKKWHLTASFTDHEPMDEIDALFAELQVYGDAGNTLSFRAVCGRLEELLESLSMEHRITLWNFL